MEDIEEYYETENEKGKEEFIEDIKKENIEKVEKKYKEKLKELRKRYEKEYKKNLETEKIKEIERINNRIKLKTIVKNKKYEAKVLDLELTRGQRLNLWFSSISYKLKRKLIDFYDRFVPNSIIYFNYKLKKNIKRNFDDVTEFIANTFNTIVHGITYFFHVTNNSLINFFVNINENIKNLINKIFKKKKEDKKENGNTKTEEGDNKEEKSP